MLSPDANSMLALRASVLDAYGGMGLVVEAGVSGPVPQLDRGGWHPGLDGAAAPAVGLVVPGNGSLPLRPGCAAVVLSMAQLDAAPFFWEAFLDLLRLLEPGGVLCLSVPVEGRVEPAFHDYWRFAPDAGRALAAWGRQSGEAVSLVESFTMPIDDVEAETAFVAVFLRADEVPAETPLLSGTVRCHNVQSWASTEIRDVRGVGESRRMAAELRRELEALRAGLVAAEPPGPPEPLVMVAPDGPLLDPAAFLDRVAAYASAIAATDAAGLRRLWTETSFPYALPAALSTAGPFSAAYRAAVEGLAGEIVAQGAALAGAAHALPRVAVPDAGVVGRIEACAEGPRAGGPLAVVEFGTGFGVLALELARRGHRVCTVDTPGAASAAGLLAGLAQAEKLALETMESGFAEAAAALPACFDVAVFQGTFQHGLDFEAVLAGLQRGVLTPRGAVLMFDTPVVVGLPFDWGPGFDGASLWSTMARGCACLSFELGYFSRLLLRHGFFLETLPGRVWRGVRVGAGIAFGRWALPPALSESFHPADPGEGGRFCREVSTLPGLGASGAALYRLELSNYAPLGLDVTVEGSGPALSWKLEAGDRLTVEVPAACETVTLRSATFCPATLGMSGDTRELGLSLVSVSIEWHARSVMAGRGPALGG